MADTDIESLVDTFDMNIEALKNGKTKAEAEVRKNYIDPMFEALGWNVRNAGLHEYEKEVVAEYSVQGELGTKKADYCFRLNGKDMFFVEAKDPSVHIENDKKTAFQIRSYCWSAKVPLGVLTDFEEFAIYDGGHEPKITDSTDTARIAYFNFKEYKDRWNEIAGVFSKEAVTNGSLDKYIRKAKRKKGIPVDETFLKDMEHWREILAVNIASLNPELSRREINFAVQRTIDRIVFLRICEDRGTEAYGRIKRLSVKRNIYAGLVNLFREADAKYNSGIFCFAAEKGRTEGVDTLTPNLKMDDSVLKTVIDRLYYPSPYNFSVMPADILGQIYERFLGRVIEISSERKVSVEEKPEVRKAGGVYYTPTYIVNYIVENTIDKLIDGKTPAHVSKMRFLDPACGSGSFLIQAYQHLLNWHLAWYSENDLEKHIKGKRPVLVKDRKGSVRLSIDERKKILLNNIFGVDIDFQAVEVTKLSLLLKVLEGEDDLTMQQLGIFKERALPDLGKNIKCGNSLIGPDYYENVQMNLNDEDEILRVNVFDWNSEFPEIMENGGFDAVIGNPPYGALFLEQDTVYLSQKFNSYEYQLNSFIFFMERGGSLLKQNGKISFIVPAVFLAQHYFKNIRKIILSHYAINSILLLNYKVFKDANIGDTCIYIFDKTKIRGNDTVKYAVLKNEFSFKNIITEETKQSDFSENQRHEIYLSGNNDLISKTEKISVSLGETAVCIMGIKPYQKGKGKPKQVEQTVKERIYDSTFKKDELYKKYLIGKDIDRYCIKPAEERYIKYGEWLAEPRYAAPFEKDKIVLRQTSDKIRAVIDKNGYYNLNNIYNIELKNDSIYNYNYILGILNSRLIVYIYQKTVPEKGKLFAEIKKTNLIRLPICKIDFHDKQQVKIYNSIIEAVDNMLSLHKQLQNSGLPQVKTALRRQIETTDRQIDQLVYKLYGLTDEEIKTVEEGSQK